MNLRKKLQNWPNYVCSGVIHPDEMKSSDESFPLIYNDCIKEKSESDLNEQEEKFFGTAEEQCFYQSVILRFHSNTHGGPSGHEIYTPLPIHKKSYAMSANLNLV